MGPEIDKRIIIYRILPRKWGEILNGKYRRKYYGIWKCRINWFFMDNWPYMHLEKDIEGGETETNQNSSALQLHYF
jgi:hypothetical protein